MSSILPVVSGVPQEESILGPFLLMVFVNYIPSLINPRHTCAAKVTVVVLCVCVSVCLSVCLSVYDYSRTTGYEVA